ncbi:MAG: nuclear transport factor 2 family protein [Bacteroidales bacterium]
MKKSIYIMLMAVTLFTACKSNNSNVDTKAEADEIRKLEDQWTAALQTKDLEKTMSFFATDAVGMSTDQAIISGIDSLRKKQEEAFADTTTIWDKFSWTNESVEVSASGDLAYVRGSSKFAVKTPVGIVEGTGKGIDVWKKIDGEWKAVASIGNGDKALTVMRTSPALVAEFTKIEEDWNKASLKKDEKAMEQLFATEYESTGDEGLTGKEKDIKNIISDKFKILTPQVLSNIKVNVYGTVAVVKGLNTVKATYEGKDISGSYYFVDVFVQRDGRWQCVSTQGTKKK